MSKNDNIIFNGSLLVGYRHPRGMLIKPTAEGREEAQEILDEGKSTYEGMFDLMEEWVQGEWMWIPPEEIGALTDAPIISPDATIEDDGSYTIFPGGAVYWHSNYMVEDPVEKWARGEGVVWDVSRAVEENPSKAGAPPEDLKRMLDHSVDVIKRDYQATLDLSDRAQAVQVYGGLMRMLWTWARGPGEHNPNYARFNESMQWTPPTKAASQWVEDTNDARHRTQVMAALKRRWPEAYKWMVKHKMGERKSKRNNPPPTSHDTRKLKNKLMR